jgi:hypothetical protein
MPPEKTIQYDPLPEESFYREIYANNVYFEPSAWDLKLIFGQLDQRQGKTLIRQHTAVTLTWPEVKVVLYWLRGQLQFHEETQGKVIIPPAGLPGEVPPPTEETKQTEPNSEKAFVIFKKLREELLKEQKG